MNICFITPEFITEQYYSGGVAQATYRKAKWLSENGHQVHIIIRSVSAEVFQKDGFWVHPADVKERAFYLKMLRLLTFYRLNGALFWFLFSLKVWLVLRRLSKNIKFDVVESPSYRACGLFAMLFLKGPAHVLFSVSYAPACNEGLGIARNLDVRTMERMEALCCRLSKNIYSPSISLKHTLEKELGLKKIEILRIPFYQEVLKLDDSVYERYLKSRQYLLFFGRLQLHKGAHILADALGGFFSAYPEAYAVFAGPDAPSKLGPSMREYIITVNKAFQKRLIFLDQIAHDKLYPVIANARLVVLPSLSDNLPNVLLEAMGSARPVIGTYGASFDEMIEDGVNGFLVGANDSRALSKKIIDVWPRQDLDNIGKAAQEKVKEFAPEKTIAALLDYYAHSIQG